MLGPESRTADRELTRALATGRRGLLARHGEVVRSGIEQEFRVVDGRGRQVDFAALARAGALPGRPLDPADPHAHRQPTGGVITADDQEAEVATPVAPIGPGVTERLQEQLADLRARLGGALDGTPAARAVGVSTHVNVEVPDDQVVACAEAFAARHSAAMMLLLDRSDSPGLLVRPRRGRLELGGEYAVGHQLSAAVVLAAAAARECRTHRAGRDRPLVDPVVVPAHQRFGWYVDRHALGGDLYRDGRVARLGRTGRVTGQDLLDWSWERCRPHALDLVSAREVALVDDVVAGRHPLPCEQPDVEPPALLSASAATDLTNDVAHGTLTLSPLVLTWDHAAYLLGDGVRTRVVTVPAGVAGRFVELFAWGTLVGWAEQVLATDPRALPVLTSARDTRRGGVFRGTGAGLDLQPPERRPLSGELDGTGGGVGREHKHDGQEDASRPPHRDVRPRTLRGLLATPVVAGALVLLLLLGSATAVALVRREAAADRAAAARAAAAAKAAAEREERARVVERTEAFAGTYAVTETVTQGNSTSPVGSSSTYDVRIGVECTASADCTATLRGAGGTEVDGSRARWVFVVMQPCEPGGAPSPLEVQITFDVTFTDQALSGTKGYRVLNGGACPGTTITTLESSLEGTRT